MKKLNFALPMVLLAGLGFAGMASANPAAVKSIVPMKMMKAQDICDMGDASDVCVLNYSGQTVYVSIPAFNLYHGPAFPSSDMYVFSAEYEYNPIEVTIADQYGNVIMDQYYPNHGPVIELDADKIAKKISVKFR